MLLTEKPLIIMRPAQGSTSPVSSLMMVDLPDPEGPTRNLDPERSLELMSLLVKINELGTTVVVVTHEKDLVDRFGKRVVTIDSGHVVNDSVGGYVGGHIHG